MRRKPRQQDAEANPDLDSARDDDELAAADEDLEVAEDTVEDDDIDDDEDDDEDDEETDADR